MRRAVVEVEVGAGQCGLLAGQCGLRSERFNAVCEQGSAVGEQIAMQTGESLSERLNAFGGRFRGAEQGGED